MFAYVKSKNNKILKVKEKESFTNNRENEPAMSGTFFFKSGETLIKACNKIIYSKDLVNNEYYVSLLFNYILNKNKFVYLIDYFFQWGTPKDLNQYLNWQENINFNKSVNLKNFVNVIMMAGKGKRMKNFNTKKPYIKLNKKKHMYEFLNSNIISKKKVCLINGDHEDEKYLNKNKYLTFIVNNTKHQIDTIYKYFCEHKKNSSNFFISPCDAKIYFKIKSLNQLIKRNKNVAMIIFTYDKYDYAKENPKEFGWLSLKTNRNIKNFLHKPRRIKGNEELITGFF
jgi:molybdopterin-guanine dinucleotide biosynthesis protein A